MSNNPKHGSNSSKPSSLFLNLSAYNRFRMFNSRRFDSFQTSSSSSSSSATDEESVHYSLSEISSAVKNSELPSSPHFRFCTKNLTVPCFSFKRCTLRNAKVVIFCRHIFFQKPDLSPSHLSTLTSRSHHPSLVKLLGASQSEDRAHVYMVYEDIPGATLRECLQNPHSNPLSSWVWRMQVALDIAQGLEYIHHHCGMVHGMIHNIIKSSTVIVTEPNSNACICLFGEDDFGNGTIHQKTDVHAFGVVILELISGKAAWEQKVDTTARLVETARETICQRDHQPEEDEETRRGRVMQFVDRRLHGSFPMETAETLIEVAVKCVDLRPEIASVAEDIRRLFLDSKVWQKETMKSPTTALSLSSLLRSDQTKDGVPAERNLLHYPSLLYP